MQGSGFVKVSSVLMIIGGVLVTIVGILAVVFVGAVDYITSDASAFRDEAGGAFSLAYVSSIVAIASGVIQFIAGIKGMIACRIASDAQKCIVWGIVVVILYLVSLALGLLGGASFSVLNFIVGLLVPALYIIGLQQIKKSAGQA